MTRIQDAKHEGVEHFKHDARSQPKSMHEFAYFMLHLSGHTKTFLTGKVIICTHTQARLVIFAKYYGDDQIKEDGTCKYICKRLETNTNFDCKKEKHHLCQRCRGELVKITKGLNMFHTFLSFWGVSLSVDCTN